MCTKGGTCGRDIHTFHRTLLALDPNQTWENKHGIYMYTTSVCRKKFLWMVVFIFPTPFIYKQSEQLWCFSFSNVYGPMLQVPLLEKKLININIAKSKGCV